MQQLYADFRVIPSHAAELHHDQFTARELAQMNAYRKAHKVAVRFPQALVLGADTLVYLGQQPLGKPADLAEARRMLLDLQGQLHQVVTGVCLLQLCIPHHRVFAVSTDVRFKPLTAEEIDLYLASVDPLDKAGAYAIQERGELLVEEVVGSYSNVVGLPLEELGAELAAWGQTRH